MTDAMMTESTTAVESQWLICQIQDRKFALNASDVVELLSLREVRLIPVPNMPKQIIGMINLRGTPLFIVDFRQLLGLQSLHDEVHAIRDMLDAREQDHVHWIEELCASVRESKAFTLATDPHQCAFGKWYDTLRADEDALNRFTNCQLAILDVVDRLDAPHQRIHALANRVQSLVQVGQAEQATKIIEDAKDTDLNELVELFSMLRELVSAARRGVIAVVKCRDTHLGLLFDSASDVRHVNAQACQLNGLAGSNDGVFDRLFRDEQDDSLIQIVQAAALLEGIESLRSS